MAQVVKVSPNHHGAPVPMNCDVLFSSYDNRCFLKTRIFTTALTRASIMHSVGLSYRSQGQEDFTRYHKTEMEMEQNVHHAIQRSANEYSLSYAMNNKTHCIYNSKEPLWMRTIRSADLGKYGVSSNGNAWNLVECSHSFN